MGAPPPLRPRRVGVVDRARLPPRVPGRAGHRLPLRRRGRHDAPGDRVAALRLRRGRHDRARGDAARGAAPRGRDGRARRLAGARPRGRPALLPGGVLPRRGARPRRRRRRGAGRGLDPGRDVRCQGLPGLRRPDAGSAPAHPARLGGAEPRRHRRDARRAPGLRRRLPELRAGRGRDRGVPPHRAQAPLAPPACAALRLRHRRGVQRPRLASRSRPDGGRERLRARGAPDPTDHRRRLWSCSRASTTPPSAQTTTGSRSTRGGSSRTSSRRVRRRRCSSGHLDALRAGDVLLLLSYGDPSAPLARPPRPTRCGSTPDPVLDHDPVLGAGSHPHLLVRATRRCPSPSTQASQPNASEARGNVLLAEHHTTFHAPRTSSRAGAGRSSSSRSIPAGDIPSDWQSHDPRRRQRGALRRRGGARRRRRRWRSRRTRPSSSPASPCRRRA